MVIGEVVLTAIADAVIAYAFEQGADKLGTRVREKLGLDPTKKAFKEALGQAFIQLRDQHPQWVAENFDASFFEHEGASILPQFLVLDGQDEIVSAEERLGVVRQVEDFVRRYNSKANRFVITSRIAGYRNAPLGEPFVKYTVQEMNETQRDADDPSPKIKEEVRKFIAAVHEHAGLFVERAPKRYGFLHLTFEEYYVARHLVARRKLVAKLIRQHLHQPRWEEPILLALGFVGLEYLAEGEEAKDFGFVSSNFEDLLGQDFLLALRCLGDSIPVRPRLLRRLIERLVDELLHNSDSARYQRHRQSLDDKLAHLAGTQGASEILPLFIEALQGARRFREKIQI